MGVNRNAKNLKSDKRLEREYYRRDSRQMDLYMDFEDRILPERPRGNIFYIDENEDKTAVVYSSGGNGFYANNVCIYCWSILYNGPDAGRGGVEWVHALTASPRCYRKCTLVATPIPGIHIIDELDL